MKKTIVSIITATMVGIAFSQMAFASTEIGLGDTIAITTDHGSFDIQINEVHLVDSWDGNDSVKDINLLCVINNYDYQSWVYDGADKSMMVYNLSSSYAEEVLLKVEDEEGFALNPVDVMPYSDGDYANCLDIPFNTKVRCCLPFECPASNKSVHIVIQDEYYLDVEFDAEGNANYQTPSTDKNSVQDVQIAGKDTITYEELVEKVETLTQEVEDLKREVAALK